MNDRFVELEERVERLEGALRRLDQRVSTLDSGAPSVEPAPEPPAPAVPSRAGALPVAIALAGRSCLVLGGAFLIRAATESRAVPRGVGIAAGLAYAAVWLFLADRDGRRGRVASAAFHGVTAAGIAYPLLWESCVRFGLISPGTAVATAALTTAVLLALSLRQPRPVLAWAATFGALSTLLALVVSTGKIAPASGALILLAGATMGLAEARGWFGPRWPAALGANLAIVALPALVGRSVSPGEAIGLAVGLPAVGLAAFAAGTLLRRRLISAFDVVQVSLSLLLGFGVAISVARTAGLPFGLLGAAVLAAGAGSYIVAFRFRERAFAANFYFGASLGLILMTAGAALWLPRLLLAFFWSALAVGGAVASMLAAAFSRETLRWHCAAYVAAAAFASGLWSYTGGAFAGPLDGGAQGFPATALGAWLTAFAAFGLLTAARPSDGGPKIALPSFLLGIVTLAGLGAAVIRLLSTADAAEGGRLAAIRTGVLAASALAASLLGRNARLRELGWLVYPLLGLGGLKLLVEDVPRGTPLTLFVGFAFYGTALLVAPRIARRGVTSGKASA